MKAVIISADTSVSRLTAPRATTVPGTLPLTRFPGRTDATYMFLLSVARGGRYRDPRRRNGRAAPIDVASMPTPQSSPVRVRVGVVGVMPLSEAAVAERVVRGWAAGDGGSIVTVNVDIARAATRRPELAELVSEAEVVVADGMPIVWAAALAGTPVPERVTGSSLVFSLSAAAAREGRSVYLLGGAPGVPEAAAAALAQRFPG